MTQVRNVFRPASLLLDTFVAQNNLIEPIFIIVLGLYHYKSSVGNKSMRYGMGRVLDL